MSNTITKERNAEIIETLSRNDQELYKQAFHNFIGNAEATEGMDEQKAMLKASALGTAADIDLFIANKETAENKFWLKNLDVALHFGNNSTAQALIRHGAEVKAEYEAIALRYCNEDTVQALRTATETQS